MDSHHVIQCNINTMLCQQMIVIKLKNLEQYCPNNAGDNVHSCPRLALFSQPDCSRKFQTLLLNPWTLVCASEIQIFQLPRELSENGKMFQLQASKHKLGRGFLKHRTMRGFYISGLSQVWLCFKTYWNLNYISNLIEIWISEKVLSLYNASWKCDLVAWAVGSLFKSD